MPEHRPTFDFTTGPNSPVRTIKQLRGAREEAPSALEASAQATRQAFEDPLYNSDSDSDNPDREQNDRPEHRPIHSSQQVTRTTDDMYRRLTEGSVVLPRGSTRARFVDNESRAGIVQDPAFQPPETAADLDPKPSEPESQSKLNIIESLKSWFAVSPGTVEARRQNEGLGTIDVAQASEPQLGFWKIRDAAYSELLEGAQDKYRYIPRAAADAAQILTEVLPLSIQTGPVMNTLELAARREAEAIVLREGGDAKGKHGITAQFLGDRMPNKVQYGQHERMQKVAKLAGRKGVADIVDISIEDPHERSLAAVRKGLGVLGIEVHENSLRNRLEVDGLDAAARLVTASRTATDGSTYVDSGLLDIHVTTYEVGRPGGPVTDFEATVFLRGSRNTRQLVTLRPVSSQSAGLDSEATLQVDGIGVNPEIGEYVGRALRNAVETERVELGNGLRRVTTSSLAADLSSMVEDLCDPGQVGRRVSRITPTGNMPLQIESGKSFDDEGLIEDV